MVITAPTASGGACNGIHSMKTNPGMYHFTNFRFGTASATKYCQVNSIRQPIYWKEPHLNANKRRFYGDLTGNEKPDIDTKAIAMNHEKINIAIEQAALKREQEEKVIDKTTNEFATPAMSHFKAKSFNPMKAPMLFSEERLKFMQMLTPPPEAIRNPRLEAAERKIAEETQQRRADRRLRRTQKAETKKLKAAKMARAKTSVGGSVKTSDSRSSIKSALTAAKEDNDMMRQSLKDMKSQLTLSNKQLDAIRTGKGMKAVGWGHPYTTYNSARRVNPHPLDVLPTNRTESTLAAKSGAGTDRSYESLTTVSTTKPPPETTRTFNSGLDSFGSHASQWTSMSKATSATCFAPGYGLYC